MKKILFTILLIFGSIVLIQAQTDTISPGKKAVMAKMKELAEKKPEKIHIEKGSKEYTLRYEKLKDLEQKMENSPAKKEAKKLHKSITDKFNQKVVTSIYYKKDVFYPWIEENINSTKFRNVDAAKEEWQKLQAANDKNMEVNIDYYAYKMELTLTMQNFVELNTDVAMALIFDKIPEDN